MLESLSPSGGPSAVDSPQTHQVTVFVLAVDGVVGDDTIAAIEGQVHQTTGTTIIGGGSEGRERADGLGLPHETTMGDAVGRLDRSVDLVWFVHGDAVPRPDALGALVAELARSDASMVGSKILRADDESRLESVGAATDVFGEPYSGLDPDEVDLEQYDVVRDVSFVSGVSVLIRRDLLRGLRGIDRQMPPVAAGLDLSQRGRIAGGRVMVVPSSETLHHSSCGHDVAGWREQAGRMRAMAKAYRLVTLAWVVPVGFMVGLIDGLSRLFLGQARPLMDFVRAAWWNFVHSPSTVSERVALRRVRQESDEELFRYQVSGSLLLRRLATEWGERFGWVIDEDEGIVTEEEMEAESNVGGLIVAGASLIAIGLGARALWAGATPAVGFSLPLSADSGSVLGSWAGGWNPTGLGSSDPTHPSVALAAAARWLLGGWSGSQALVAFVSMVAGVLLLGRVLRRLGVDGPSRFLAGILLYFGAGGMVLTGAADWAGLVAIGPALWLLNSVLAPWPGERRRRIGVVGAVVASAVVTGFAAPLVPVLIGVFSALGWALVPSIRGAVPVNGAVGAVAGSLSILPYLLRVSWEEISTGGPFYRFDTTALTWLAVGVAALAVILGGSAVRWRTATWAGLGAFAAPVVVSATDWSGDAAGALGTLAAIGAAIVVGLGLAFEPALTRPSSLVRAVAAVAATAAVVLSLGPLVGGRAGLPVDQWSERLEFVDTLSEGAGGSRVLLIGGADELPGEHRSTELFSYRLVTGSRPTLDQARLADPRSGDEALGEVLGAISTGGVVRPGALLAPFAIRWVVVFDGVPIIQNLDVQVDLAPLPVAEGVSVFDNLAHRPRVEASDASEWTATRTGASGPAHDGTVRWADNASERWEPLWSQSEWFNLVSGEEGVVRYRPDPVARNTAWIAVVALVAGIAGAVVGRQQK